MELFNGADAQRGVRRNRQDRRFAFCRGFAHRGVRWGGHSRCKQLQPFSPNAASSTVKPVMLPPGAAAILDIARKDEPLKEARNALRGIGAHDRLDVVGGAST